MESQHIVKLTPHCGMVMPIGRGAGGGDAARTPTVMVAEGMGWEGARG